MMTDDLVERLRRADRWDSHFYDDGFGSHRNDQTPFQAADRIEALEKRLEVVPGWSESADGISCRDDTIRLLDARIATLTTELTALRDAGDRLAGALEAIEGGNIDRPLGKSWFPDGRPSKHDRCIHDVWMYEACENCIGAHCRAALAQYEATKP